MCIPKQVSRREFVRLTGLTAGVACSALAVPGRAAEEEPIKRDPDSVLARLLKGNERFASGQLAHPRRKPEDFQPLAEGQAPLAVIIGCADARVAPELLFDEGVGELFVVRVAGNIVSGAGASVKGSVEYAVAELGVRLIMVLGHSNCGAVKAALKYIDAKDALPGAIGDLVDTIRPAAAAAKNKPPGEALDIAIKRNVQRGVERLNTLHPIVASGVNRGDVKVVGAVYDLHSGRVKVLG